MLHHYDMPDEFGMWSSSPSVPIHTEYALPSDFERNHLFVAQMAHFLEVVEGKTEPRCSLDDGIEVQKLVEAVRKH